MLGITRGGQGWAECRLCGSEWWMSQKWWSNDRNTLGGDRGCWLCRRHLWGWLAEHIAWFGGRVS